MGALRLVLASASPRRQELLRLLTTRFEVVPSGVEEAGSSREPSWLLPPLNLPEEYAVPPDSHPALWAWRKAVDAAEQMGNPSDTLILAADTVVIAEGRLLGKPLTPEAALEMLALLRGRKHYVATGGVLLDARSPDTAPLQAFSVLSAVRMRQFSNAELAGYVATGEPLDKAGAYAVQGEGGRLVERVDGCYFNVVGLPVCVVREALDAAGLSMSPHPERGYCAYCPLQASQ